MGCLINPQRLSVTRCRMTVGRQGGGALTLGGWVSWCWGGEGARGWAVTHRTRGVGTTSDTCLCTGPWEMHPTLAVKVLPESLQLTQNRGRRCPPGGHPISPCPQGAWSANLASLEATPTRVRSRN